MPTGVYSRRPLAERFWSKVGRRGPDECWPWLGKIGGHGYGVIRDHYKDRSAPRIALELVGRPAGDFQALHRCDNRRCVNPAHLYVGTAADNMRDMADRGRQWKQGRTRCTNGHPINEQNSRYRAGANGREFRRCRPCERAASARYKQRRSA